MKNVFISYVGENRATVLRLAEALRAFDVPVWLDRDSLQPGVHWESEIRNAIAEGDFFLACFSREYEERSRAYMNEELVRAIEELRRRTTKRAWFIPVLLNECDIPDRDIGAGETLRSLQWVSLYENWADGIGRILAVVAPTSGKLHTLQRQLDSGSVGERIGAAEGLGAMGSQAQLAIPALAALLRDRNDSVKAAAAAALGNIGTASHEAIAALVRIRRRGNDYVREQAEQALAKLGHPAVPAPLRRESDVDTRRRGSEVSRQAKVRLAGALRDLRQSYWSDVVLTQVDLARAFSTEARVAPATISSWESMMNPKIPPVARLSDYARFFATRRSLEGDPHLIPEYQLTQSEMEQFRQLEGRLLGFLRDGKTSRRRLFSFDNGPVVVIAADFPPDLLYPRMSDNDPNSARFRRYGDPDALVELYGFLRASNPTLDVFMRSGSETVSDDLSSHVVLLGGVNWNQVTRSFQRVIQQVPISQIAVDDLKTGDIFTVTDQDGNRQTYYPTFEEVQGDRELIADVGFLARLPNPFRDNRTLTICSGIHSRGVFGAVRCLTDARVREENEEYLENRFPDGRFALLLRVPVVAGYALSPDLQNPDSRLYEWPTVE